MSKYNDYHEYERLFIGASDIAALTLVGITEQGLEAKVLDFGEDGSYYAYVIDDDLEIPNHYKLIYTFKSWMKVYDDEELMQKFQKKLINVYRCGDFGCIIQLKNKI